MNTVDFAQCVKEFANQCDEISRAMVELRELRKQKEKLGDIVAKYMTDHGVDTVELDDSNGRPNGKVEMKLSKRAKPVTKQHILRSFVTLTNDESKASQAFETLYNQREVEEKMVVSRTGGRTSP